VKVRNCFLFLMMLMRVVSGKSRPRRVGLRTGILRLRALMDGILFYGKENVLIVEINRFRKMIYLLKFDFGFKPLLYK
jgi:hypothetical protein